MSVETEIKLSLSPRVAGSVMQHPAIERTAATPATSAQLLSIYYDTPGFDLWAAGIALRLRRTQAGWVQTVKWGGAVLGGLHRRNELEIPVLEQKLDLDAVTEPDLARTLSQARLRRRIKPVFVTEFVRTARVLTLPGDCKVELSLDRGQIIAGTAHEPICEVEMELAHGSAAALFDLVAELEPTLGLRPAARSKAERGYVLAGGKSAPLKARPVVLTTNASIADSATRIIASGLAQLEANEHGMLMGRDPEYLHQMRVAVRRLRSCLSAYSRALPSDPFDVLRAELKWLGSRLGPARDWDVFITELLPPLKEGLFDAEDLAALEHSAERLRDKAYRSACAAVKSRRYARALFALGRINATDEWCRARHLGDPVLPFAASLLDRRLERVLDRGGGRRARSVEQLHALRIAVKKLRYAVEFFSTIYPDARLKPFREHLVHLQECLGSINDTSVMRALVRLAVPAKTRLADAVTGWSARVIVEERQRLRALWRAFRRRRKYW